jgi:hypothetical protein
LTDSLTVPTNPLERLYSAEHGRPGRRAWSSQEIRADRADVARELRDVEPEIREEVSTMARAMLDGYDWWSHLGSLSPDTRDAVWYMQRSVGIGTPHGEIDGDMLDAFDDYTQDGHTAVECAVWLHGRLFG